MLAPFSSRNVPLQPLLVNNTPHCETQRQSETRARHTGAPGTDPLPSACRNCIRDSRHQQACLSPHKALPKNTGQRQSLSTERPQSITQALSDRLLNRSSHWRNAWCCLLVFVPAVFQESACNNPCGHCPNMLTHSTNNRAWECAEYFSDGQNQQLVRLQKKFQADNPNNTLFSQVASTSRPVYSRMFQASDTDAKQYFSYVH